MNQIIIGIGSNIEPEKNVSQVMKLLAVRYEVLKTARLLKTKAIGKPNQPDYINSAVLIRTELSQEQLAPELFNIELEFGRVRTGDRYAPRTIDLDILVCNGKITDTDVYERDFLRTNILDIYPDFVFERNED